MGINKPCPRCRRICPGQARYCPRCGLSVAEFAQPAAMVARPTAVAPSVGNSMPIVSTTAIGVIVAIFCVLLFFSRADYTPAPAPAVRVVPTFPNFPTPPDQPSNDFLNQVIRQYPGQPGDYYNPMTGQRVHIGPPAPMAPRPDGRGWQGHH